MSETSREHISNGLLRRTAARSILFLLVLLHILFLARSLCICSVHSCRLRATWHRRLQWVKLLEVEYLFLSWSVLLIEADSCSGPLYGCLERWNIRLLAVSIAASRARWLPLATIAPLEYISKRWQLLHLRWIYILILNYFCLFLAFTPINHTPILINLFLIGKFDF